MLFTTILTTSLTILSSAFFAEANDPRTHDVIVGGAAGLVYTPNQVWAQVGDHVTFHFQFKNHSATQGSFEYPCNDLKDGFDSGFMPVGMDVKDGPTFTIEVKDEYPIWVHCEQDNHCASGMVFAVNAPDKGDTFEKYLENAKQSHHDDGSYNDDGSNTDDGSHTDDGSYNDGSSYKRSDNNAKDIKEKRGLLSRIMGKGAFIKA